ncbi:hypothetical protein A2716_00500 [candidate division WWE3 bacterium RIFCSPHIGHO2_01_FULL_40_23]|uniref:Uncharacterized protein n=1 Tax=candidate division WWE3 bacterium RIFCSPLOWO2_01_FULL_41_18 TaxID=1802625 RepID=A0A1F4VE99_UNCKA|nr:MAG: hypothetical protein A2716_00500 [candidate division WWE3 bacterium RIFCSPHIGHO2_01_FULL_40_23]OGC55475.1 MAG: hypothetical protein A3A78_00770 [candidate division WWE3 bacterium RIFCSPLOWO2_01_FULL_41_18]
MTMRHLLWPLNLLRNGWFYYFRPKDYERNHPYIKERYKRIGKRVLYCGVGVIFGLGIAALAFTVRGVSANVLLAWALGIFIYALDDNDTSEASEFGVNFSFGVLVIWIVYIAVTTIGRTLLNPT